MSNNDHRLTRLDIVLMILTTAYILAGISIAPFHGDESAYIWMSEDYDRLKNREFEKVFYSPEGNPKQYLRLTTGSILSYAIGFLRDITNNEDPIEKWLWGSSWEDNIAMGKMPAPRLLIMGRAVSALMGAGGIIVFFLVAFKLSSSRMVAWCGTLALASNGPVLVNVRRAMQEGPKFLFLILTVYVASFILSNLQSAKMRWIPYISLGFASGLTLAAKQDTAPILVAIYVGLALTPLWRKAGLRVFLTNSLYLFAATSIAYASFLLFMPVFWDWWETAFMLIGVSLILFQWPLLKSEQSGIILAVAGFALVAAMTFVSPSLWRDVQTPIFSMLETRKGVVAGQSAVIGEANRFEAGSMKNRLGFLLQNTVKSDVMYMETASFDVPAYHALISEYEDSSLSGRTGSDSFDGLLALCAIIGAWVLLKRFTVESLFIHSLFFITAILLYFLISLSWQRYFLIMQIPYSLLIGIGAGRIWIWLGQLSKQRQVVI